jgi:hypothetical protein
VIKVECEVDVLSEEDSIDMKPDELYIPSTVSIKNVESEVSLLSS